MLILPRAYRQAFVFIGGLVGYALLWEVVGRFGIVGGSWPPLSSIFATMTSDRYLPSLLNGIANTAREAMIGYVIGVGIAIVMAFATILVPVLSGGVNRLAAFANALPPIILGPLLMATTPRDQAPIVMSAMVVSFGVFIALSAGLHSARPAHVDLFRVLGASRVSLLLRLQVPSAVPQFADGLRLAAPTAILGATLAEWFGAERGIGPIFVAAMQNYQIQLLWSAALLTAFASMLAYGLLTIVQLQVRQRLL